MNKIIIIIVVILGLCAPNHSVYATAQTENSPTSSYYDWFYIEGNFQIIKVKKVKKHIVVFASQDEKEYVFLTKDRKVRKYLKKGNVYKLKGHHLFETHQEGDMLQGAIPGCWILTETQRVAVDISIRERIDNSQFYYLDYLSQR